MGTRQGNVWLDRRLGEQPAGRAEVGLDVRLRVVAVGSPFRTQLRVWLNGPTGGGLWTSTSYLQEMLQGGQSLDRTVTLAEPGTYTLRIEPVLGPVTWSASVTGTGAVAEAAWRVPALWSVVPGLVLLVVGAVAVAALRKDEDDRRVAGWLALGAAALAVAAGARVLVGADTVALPVWGATVGAVILGGAALLCLARHPVLPEGLRTWARRRLGWIVEPAEGALRGWRLAFVVTTAVLVVALGTTLTTPSGPRSHGQMDLEGVEARGPATLVVLMDTRGAPFRVRAPARLDAHWVGKVGPGFTLEAYVTAGAGRTAARLLDPNGTVTWRKTSGRSSTRSSTERSRPPGCGAWRSPHEIPEGCTRTSGALPSRHSPSWLATAPCATSPGSRSPCSRSPALPFAGSARGSRASPWCRSASGRRSASSKEPSSRRTGLR